MGRSSITYRVAIGLVIGLNLSSCVSESDPNPEKKLAGGEATIFSSGPDAYTFPLANLDAAGLSEHLVADGAFGQNFVSAPAERFGGLGPVFNQNSCESCHIRNGRGTIPQFDGDQSSGLLLRLSVPGSGSNGEPIPVPGFGGQLQTKAIFGVKPEGQISVEAKEKIVQFVNGDLVTLTELTFGIVNPYIALEGDVLISPRNAQPVYGLGLLEAIPESDILALADENDANGDGISGKANYVWDVLKGETGLGRFGWKAEQPSGLQQSAAAAHNDMGLTNFLFNDESCDGQDNCDSGLQVELDVDVETTRQFTFYFQTLAVPAQRNQNTEPVKSGSALFSSIGCAKCHVPKQITGAHDIQALSNQTIYPYTDLLLHDMGDDLSDNRPVFQASGNEWRTPPLWGIGLAKVVNGKATFLHDGRAKTLEEAILWHGGEAKNAQKKYLALFPSKREALIAFLESL